MAVRDGDTVQTWSQLRDRVARLADGLTKLGVQIGDRVAILAANSGCYLEALYAAWWAGTVVVPLNTRWAVAENIYALTDSGCTVLIVDDQFAPSPNGWSVNLGGRSPSSTAALGNLRMDGRAVKKSSPGPSP